MGSGFDTHANADSAFNASFDAPVDRFRDRGKSGPGNDALDSGAAQIHSGAGAAAARHTDQSHQRFAHSLVLFGSMPLQIPVRFFAATSICRGLPRGSLASCRRGGHPPTSCCCATPTVSSLRIATCLRKSCARYSGWSHGERSTTPTNRAAPCADSKGRRGLTHLRREDCAGPSRRPRVCGANMRRNSGSAEAGSRPSS